MRTGMERQKLLTDFLPRREDTPSFYEDFGHAANRLIVPRGGTGTHICFRWKGDGTYVEYHWFTKTHTSTVYYREQRVKHGRFP